MNETQRKLREAQKIKRAHCPFCHGGAVDLETHIENCVMRPDDRAIELAGETGHE